MATSFANNSGVQTNITNANGVNTAMLSLNSGVQTNITNANGVNTAMLSLNSGGLQIADYNDGMQTTSIITEDMIQFATENDDFLILE